MTTMAKLRLRVLAAVVCLMTTAVPAWAADHQPAPAWSLSAILPPGV